MPARSAPLLSLILALLLPAGAQTVFPIGNNFQVFQPAAGCGSGCDYLPGQTVSGDFNGDNKLDFAYVELPSYVPAGQTAPPDYLVVVLGNSNGVPQQIATPLIGCSTTAIAAADLNQDHKLDVVLLCSQGFAEALIGNGDGTFQPPIPFSVPATVSALTLADFNGDGLPDIAFALSAQGGAAPGYAIAVNQNNGHFAAPVTYTLAGVPIAIAAGDFNGDGKQDLAFNNGYVLGNGDGTFSSERSLPANITQIAVADFNHDGYSDLVYAVDGSPSIALLNGSSSGLSAQPVTIPAPSLFTASLQPLAAGSGQLDLLAFLRDGGAAVLTPDGRSSFLPPIVWANAAYAVADMNLDGLPDLVGYDEDHQTFFIASGTGSPGLFQGIPLTLASNGPFAMADMNGDGLPDIVNKPASGPPQVYLSSGNGRFVAQAAPSTTTTDTGSFLVTADFTGDSHPDVASISSFVLCGICGSSPGPAQIFSYIGNGDGTLTFLKAASLPFQTTTAALAGDFNGDGKQDLILTYSDQGGGAVFLPGNGDGTFGSPASIALLGHTPAALAAADLNGDGHLDLVVADAAGTVISYLGKGDGTFSAVSQILSTNPVSMTIADVTGDGIPDLVYSTSTALQINAGTGSGAFSSTPVFSASIPAGTPSQVQTGDLNGDGLPDIAVSSRDHVTVFLNQGSGNFAADTNVYAPVPGTSSAMFLARLNSSSAPSGNKRFLDACIAHPFTSSGSGAGIVGLLNQNNASPSLSAALQPTATYLTAGASTTAQGLPLTLTAAVAPSSATGTVTFLDGTATLGTAALSGGAAALPTSTLAIGSHSITASYGGDGMNAPSLSSPVSLSITAATLQLSASPASMSIVQGGSGTATLTVAPVGAYSGTVTLACSGLPAYSACSFSPATLTFSAASQAAQKTTLTITTTGPTHALLRMPGSDSGAWLACLILMPSAFLIGFRRRGFRNIACVLLLAAGSFVLWGCGGASNQPAPGPVTPVGAATVTISVSGANLSTTLTVNVTQ